MSTRVFKTDTAKAPASNLPTGSSKATAARAAQKLVLHPGRERLQPAPRTMVLDPPAAQTWTYSADANRARADDASAMVERVAAHSEIARRRLIDDGIGQWLVQAVARPRTESIIGQEGVMGVRQAEQAAETLRDMPEDRYQEMKAVLAWAGIPEQGAPSTNADPDTERALILKALAARQAVFTRPAVTENEIDALNVAWERVGWLAGEIRGKNRDEVIRDTTLLDVDDRRNSSAWDPLNPGSQWDSAMDNDGYVQRFSSSCAPAVAIMLRGEVDPAWALMVARTDSKQSPDPDGPLGARERDILERDRFFTQFRPQVTLTADEMARFRATGELPPGVQHSQGAAVSRIGEAAHKRMIRDLPSLRQPGKEVITKDQEAALIKRAEGGQLSPRELVDSDVALRALRAVSTDHPTDLELSAMAHDQRFPTYMDLKQALLDVTTSWLPEPTDEFPVGDSLDDQELAKVARYLEAGTDIALRLATPGHDGGHFIVLSDVRKQRGELEFLASDPLSGRSRWLKQSVISDPHNNWPTREFDVHWQGVVAVHAPLSWNRL